MKKIPLKKLTCFLCAAMAFSSCFISCGEVEGNGKNLIYIIGDGMGFNHIENAKLYMEVEELGFEEYYVGEVMTYSADNEITDSAAGATALATGVKTNNDVIGLDPSGNVLENLMEISKKAGKKTGVVTTDYLDGATPAGFSGHSIDRNYRLEIMHSQISGKVDLLMGKFSVDYNGYRGKFIEGGFSYAKTMEELGLLPTDGRILANIQSVSPTHGADDVTTVVPLKELVTYALDYLSKDNEDGFTLMVEGAYIDKHSHSKDILKMLYAMMDLNDAIEYIFEWASERNDTSIILTADHETGGLKKAENKEGLSSSLYTSSNHTAANVPLYLYNADEGAAFVKEQLNLVENTDVFKIAKQIVVG